MMIEAVERLIEETKPRWERRTAMEGDGADFERAKRQCRELAEDRGAG